MVMNGQAVTDTRPSSEAQPAGETRPSAAAADARPGRTVTFRVSRSKRGEQPHFEGFDVPVEARTTVLDALIAIRRHQDPTLTLRHSCFHASCGTCAMRVNGRDVLACVTDVASLGGGAVTVEPIANAGAVMSDLVVDMAAFVERYVAIGRPLVRESELGPGSRPAEGVERLTRFEDCIECGICMSACPISATDSRYLGPAVLAAAWRVISEPRTADPERAMALADVEHGIWRCHTAFECTEACPSNVDPAGAIMRLRGAATRRRLHGLLGGARSDR
jgi:succinate dehydrogenase / fumarate reductase iron-sulfur subunit